MEDLAGGILCVELKHMADGQHSLLGFLYVCSGFVRFYSFKRNISFLLLIKDISRSLVLNKLPDPLFNKEIFLLSIGHIWYFLNTCIVGFV